MEKTFPFYKIVSYLSDRQTFIMSNKSSKLQKIYIKRKRNMNQNGLRKKKVKTKGYNERIEMKNPYKCKGLNCNFTFSTSLYIVRIKKISIHSYHQLRISPYRSVAYTSLKT